MTVHFFKDPQAVLDYQVDWSDWLAEGEAIDESTWTVPVGITEVSNTHSDTAAVIWLSGGASEQTYMLVNHIVTDNVPPREDDRTMVIKMEHK